MDSSGSAPTEAKNIPGSSGTANLRERTVSEGSDKSGPRFILPGTPDSPPKILTLDEVQDVMKNIQNMTLAHEIAINAEFKLQPYEPPENSIEKMIKDTMHRAFWDILRQQLSQSPPCYDHAIQLLADIKEYFQSILPKNNKKALDRINEILDETVIRQQAENNVLDFKQYANFVIHVMSLACAPVRDEKVASLKEKEDVVEIFRGILETLALMRLDMANCLLDAARNEVIANSVEYEKQKFKEYLEHYKYGFPATEGWLERNVVMASDSPIDMQRVSKDTIFNAYMELMDWNAANEFPEIITVDRERIYGLQSRALRLCTCASSLAIASGVPAIGQSVETKKSLAKQLEILLQSVNNEKDLTDILENVWLHIKTVLNSRLQELNQPIADAATENTIKHNVLQLAKPDSTVRALMWKRLLTYLRFMLRSNINPPPPPGYTEYSIEIEAFATAFKRVTFYNYAVYGEYYHEMLQNKILNKSTELPSAMAASSSGAAPADTAATNKTD